ncbi:NAD-binding lipoprotein [Streptomyces sp. NPDC023723]|uniref:CASTOR/POLLUX-related putative ion channel n=1 Tax=Streptomyces sp. NPDC023723 TaxID=3154323 RepID=UPI0033D2DBFB
MFDRTLARSTGALLGWLALGCLAVVVPVSALLVWTDPDAPRSLSDRLLAVWRTSAETMRLGGVTGAPVRMLLSVLLGLIALLCVSTVVGVVTTGLGDRLTELRRGRSTVLERGHAVVLGWSEHVFTVVGELIAGGVGGRGVVTVLADLDSTDMERALRGALGLTDGVRLVCRTGAPTDPEALALVAPQAAGTVVVLPDEGPDGDLAVVRVLLALRALLGARTGPPVVAAVREERYRYAAELAAGPRGTVLETDRVTTQLLVQAARQPGLSAALRDLLDFSGAELHLFDIPEAAGLPFDELALRRPETCAVGLLRTDGRAVLTPAPGTLVRPGDRLVAVAHDSRSAPLDACRAPVDVSAMVPARACPKRPSRMLLLGWNRRAPLLVETLRRTVRPGSRLDVVAGPETGTAEIRVPRSRGAAGLHVEHRVGDLDRPDSLTGVDLADYDSVIVLGADHDGGPVRPDDRTLLTLLMLRSVAEATGRAPAVVAELCDIRSRAVVPLGPVTDVVVRGELTALLLAQIAHRPGLTAVFEELFDTRGGALALHPAERYVLPGREASFATVMAAALRHGECAIGYRACAADAPRPADGLRLCPGGTDRRVWAAQDEILVVTAGPAAPGGGHRATTAVRPEPDEGDAADQRAPA